MVPILVSPSAVFAAEDPLDELMRELERKQRAAGSSKSKVDAPTAPQPAPAPRTPPPQAESTVHPPDSTALNGRRLSCNGELVASGSLLSFNLRQERFEFETTLDTERQQHRVVRILAGPLFKVGKRYGLHRPGTGSWQLATESSSTTWQASTLNWDQVTGDLIGAAKPAKGREPRLLRVELTLVGSCRLTEVAGVVSPPANTDQQSDSPPDRPAAPLPATTPLPPPRPGINFLENDR